MRIRRSGVVRRTVSVNLSGPGQDGQVMSDLGVINSSSTCFHLRWHLSWFKSALRRPPLRLSGLNFTKTGSRNGSLPVSDIKYHTNATSVSRCVDAFSVGFLPGSVSSSNVTLHRCWIWCLNKWGFLKIFPLSLFFFVFFVKWSKKLLRSLRPKILLESSNFYKKKAAIIAPLYFQF